MIKDMCLITSILPTSESSIRVKSLGQGLGLDFFVILWYSNWSSWPPARAWKQEEVMTTKIDETMDPTSDKYKEMVADLLNRLKPGGYGTPLYNALARLGLNLAMEAVALRVNCKTGKIEVYLRQRTSKEVYPLQWHAPGSVMRADENSDNWRTVANRLSNEFGTKIVSYEEIGELPTKEERGPFLSKIFLVQLEGDPREDDRHYWCPVDDLPHTTVDHHEEHIIPLAVMKYAVKHGIRVRARIEFGR